MTDAPGRSIDLATAFMQCELHPSLGSVWAFNPERWQTSDGYVPVRVVWNCFQALKMRRAIEVIDTARGIGLAFASDDHDGARLRDDIAREAFPTRD